MLYPRTSSMLLSTDVRTGCLSVLKAKAVVQCTVAQYNSLHVNEVTWRSLGNTTSLLYRHWSLQNTSAPASAIQPASQAHPSSSCTISGATLCWFILVPPIHWLQSHTLLTTICQHGLFARLSFQSQSACQHQLLHASSQLGQPMFAREGCH